MNKKIINYYPKNSLKTIISLRNYIMKHLLSTISFFPLLINSYAEKHNFSQKVTEKRTSNLKKQ